MKKGIVLVILLLLTSTSTVSASNSNEILLKSRRFTPAKGVSAAAKAKIEAIPQRAHVLIQLEETPTIKERRELEASGIKLLAYVPNRAWFASRAKGHPSSSATSILSRSNNITSSKYKTDDLTPRPTAAPVKLT